MWVNCNRTNKRWKTSISWARSAFYVILALSQKYLAALIANNPIIEKKLREGFANAVSNITNFRTKFKENLKKIHDEFGEMSRAINFKDMQKQFGRSLSHQLKFYRNYLSLFETLLLFIRASREQL